MNSQTIEPVFNEQDMVKIDQMFKNLGLNHDHHDLEKAKYGLSSKIFKDVATDQGLVEDFAVRFKTGANKEPELIVDKVQQKLLIPDKLVGVKLTSDQKQDLENGEFVNIERANKPSLNIKIDKELNKIIVQSSKDLKVPSQIHGYKLNTQDKADWMNGKVMKARVFYDPKNKNYYRVNLQKQRHETNDNGVPSVKEELVFTNYKSLSEQEAKQITDTLNNDPLTPNLNIENVVNAIEEQNVENDLKLDAESIQKDVTINRVEPTTDKNEEAANTVINAVDDSQHVNEEKQTELKDVTVSHLTDASEAEIDVADKLGLQKESTATIATEKKLKTTPEAFVQSVLETKNVDSNKQTIKDLKVKIKDFSKSDLKIISQKLKASNTQSGLKPIMLKLVNKKLGTGIKM